MYPMSDGQFQLVYNILSFSLASMMALNDLLLDARASGRLEVPDCDPDLRPRDLRRRIPFPRQALRRPRADLPPLAGCTMLPLTPMSSP